MQRERQAMRHDAAEDGLAPRAERHPDADLAPALRHQIRQHAVGADRREQKREAGKAAEQVHQHARLPQRAADHVVHRPQPDNRERGIGLTHGARQSPAAAWPSADRSAGRCSWLRCQ